VKLALQMLTKTTSHFHGAQIHLGYY
jgi:hypothetical protein